MDQDNLPIISSTLKTVKDQFVYWRANRRNRREPIPEHLWDAAVALSKRHSINLTAKTLGLSYADLKNRVRGLDPKRPKRKLKPTSFVEISFPDSTPASECIIEMEDKSGSRMRMSFKGNVDLDLLALGKAFWSERS